MVFQNSGAQYFWGRQECAISTRQNSLEFSSLSFFMYYLFISPSIYLVETWESYLTFLHLPFFTFKGQLQRLHEMIRRSHKVLQQHLVQNELWLNCSIHFIASFLHSFIQLSLPMLGIHLTLWGTVSQILLLNPSGTFLVQRIHEKEEEGKRASILLPLFSHRWWFSPQSISGVSTLILTSFLSPPALRCQPGSLCWHSFTRQCHLP